MKRKALCLIMAALFVFMAGCNKEDGIAIGIIAPITGVASVYGTAARDGAILAFEEINAAGGILDMEIRYIIQDDKHDTSDAVTAFNRLVNRDNVVAIIGPVTSAPSNAVAAAAAESNRIPMISPTGTAEDVTSHGDFMFRACFLDAFQARSMATFARRDLSAQTAAVIFDSGDSYSEGLASNFRDQFNEMGGTVVAYEAYSTDDVDFRTQLTTIRAAGADVLFIADYYNKVALIATQVRELGIETIMLGADGWEGIMDVLDDHSIMNGSYYGAHYATSDPNPVIQNFINNYTERFGSTPNSFAALGYDATHIMAQAISEAGSTDTDAIIRALQNISYSGITGEITFDSNGDPIKNLTIIAIESVGGETVSRLHSRVSP